MHRRTFLGLVAALPFADRLRRLLPTASVKMPTAMATFHAGLMEHWYGAMYRFEHTDDSWTINGLEPGHSYWRLAPSSPSMDGIAMPTVREWNG